MRNRKPNAYRLVIVDVIAKIFDHFKRLIQSRKCHEGLSFLASLIARCRYSGTHTKRISKAALQTPRTLSRLHPATTTSHIRITLLPNSRS